MIQLFFKVFNPPGYMVTRLSHCGSPEAGPYTTELATLWGIHLSSSVSTKTYKVVFLIIFCKKNFLLNIVSRFSMPRRLAFHCHFLISDLCCLSKICHEYQSSATMNDSTSCVSADINNSLTKYGVEDMCFIFV